MIPDIARVGSRHNESRVGRRRSAKTFACHQSGAAELTEHERAGRMELYQIRYFLALCETLNFARAAERCNVSQPSLTRAMQKLEQELGGLLVHRERRRTHLTELGELVRPMLEEVW